MEKTYGVYEDRDEDGCRDLRSVLWVLVTAHQRVMVAPEQQAKDA